MKEITSGKDDILECPECKKGTTKLTSSGKLESGKMVIICRCNRCGLDWRVSLKEYKQ